MKRPSSRPPAPVATGSSKAGARPFTPRRSMLALESRIVFDGAAGAADAPADLAQLRDTVHGVAHRPTAVALEQRLFAATDPRAAPEAPGATGRSVLFVDARIPDYQRFVKAAGAGVTVVVIDRNSDGMVQMAAALQGMQGLDAISIVSHGDTGVLLLGDSALVHTDLSRYGGELAALGAALQDNGELLLYGCDVGAGAIGRDFINALAGMTGAVVAASSDTTGAAGRGGDWTLEIATGTVRSAPAFDTAALHGYDYVLQTSTVASLAQLKAAIVAGSTDGQDDTITLAANITFASAADAIRITISDGKTMTIVGAGFTIDGAYQSRVFETSTIGAGSALDLQNMTITHGRVSGNGGASGPAVDGGAALGAGISNSGTLTLNSVTVTGNFASGGGGGGASAPVGLGSIGGGGGSGVRGIGGGDGAGVGGGPTAGVAGSDGNGGRGGGYDPLVLSGQGGTSAANGSGTGGAGAIGVFGYANGGGGALASVTILGTSIGGGGGGAGWGGNGATGGWAVGGIFNAGTLSIVGSSLITNNAAAAGGGGGGGGVGNHGGTGGLGVGGILNSGADAVLRISSSNFSAMTGNVGASGDTGAAVDGASNAGFAAPASVNTISNVNGGTADTAYVPGPIVTDAFISIAGATGPGGVYRIGDTVTATWNNAAGGDNNAGVTGVTMNFSQFGGGTAVAATVNAGVFTASYTLVAGVIDAGARNVIVTATNASGTTSVSDTVNAAVDIVTPTVTDARITLAGASGAGGAYRIGDTVTASWNNSAGGDNNSDTISGVTIDFSAFGGAAAVAAVNNAGVWSASFTVVAGALDVTGRNVTVTAIDNAGNATLQADTSGATIDAQAPSVTDAGISLAGGSGTGGAFKIGDSITASWNNTTGGDNNADGINAVTVDFSQFGGGAAVAATNNAGVWSATFVAGALDVTARNVLFTVTDNAGNLTTRADTSNATVDTVAPLVTGAHISLSGASGTGGAYRIGDTVTATWNNTAGGDNNSDTVSAVNVDFSRFGGGAAVAAVNNGGIWSAQYVLTGGAIDATDRTVSISAIDNAGNTTTASSAGATVDSVAPVVSDARINITGGSGTGGAYRIGNTITATWNNSAAGDNNSDAISGVTVDFSQFGGGAAVAATNNAGVWSATFAIVAGALDATGRNIAYTVTDNAGNTTTRADTRNATIDTIAPVVTGANISISGATGLGGAYKSGDTVTITWNNSGSGDNNIDGIGSAMFAGRTATGNNGVWTASYVIQAPQNGGLDTANHNIVVQVQDNAGNQTSLNYIISVDESAPVVTDAYINISGGSGTSGAYKIGDTVTATWNNTAAGDNNADTIGSATVNFSQFGGGAAVAATNIAGVWTASYAIVAGTLEANNRNISYTVTDNAGNTTTRADRTNATVNNKAPMVTDASISISGATGTGGAYKIGDTITATWNNSGAGDGNADVTNSVYVDFTQFGGGALVAATNTNGVWSATEVITAVLDTTARNISFVVSDNAGNQTSRSDSTNATVDTIAPVVTDARISIAGGTGPGGAFQVGDTVTATWNNTAGGDNNADTIAAVSVNFAQFGGGTAVAASQVAGTWTASYLIGAGFINGANTNVSVTATDNAGNASIAADSTNPTGIVAAPVVSDANINIAGASGTGGAFRLGDTVTATWNNAAGGDNNAGVTGVTMDFSQFGGGAAVATTLSAGVYRASYKLTAGAIDAGARNVTVSASNAIGTTSVADGANAVVDINKATLTDAGISLSGASGTGGAYKIGDTITATWNNSAGGDNNSDTISGVRVDFSQFGGGAAVAATNNAGIWRASFTVVAGTLDATGRNVTVTVTDNAGNATTLADTTGATIDSVAPSVDDFWSYIAGSRGGLALNVIDTVIATWMNTAFSQANADIISGVTVNFSQFGGSTAVAATNNAGIWTAASAIAAGIEAANRNVSITVTDNAGNTATATDTSNATVDTIAPVVTDANISISGATGTGGTYKIGDTITATWNNSGSGDGNVGVGWVSADFGELGGQSYTMNSTNNVFTATYVIAAGTLDATGKNVRLLVLDNSFPGNWTFRFDSSNATVDNVAPVVTDANISIAGGTGTGGAYKIGDTVTVTWNNTAGGDNNADTMAGVTVNFAQFGGGTAVAASDNAGTWSASLVIGAGLIDGANLNVSVTATDNAGNATTTADSSGATLDMVAPTVTDANIHIAGATGTGGAYRIGDTITATWNNTAGGDNNSDTLSGVAFDFSQFGGGATVAASNNAGTWSATHVVVAGALDATGRNVAVTVTDNAGNTTTQADTTNATIDSVAPTVTDANMSIAGGTGTGGAYRIGDIVTATWNNTAAGDNNSDTISGASVDFSQFGGGIAVAASSNAGVWSATFAIVTGALDASGRNISFTVTDNAGNATTRADTSNATVDAVAPIVTDAHISISGGTGSGGAYKIGDILTATWNDSAAGDNNSDTISGATVDFSQFGGGASVAAANNAGVWSASFAIVAGALDATNRNIAYTVTDNAGNTTTRADTTNATIDTMAPIATDANISISGATGTGGAYKIGDTVTATWDNSGLGDAGTDVNFVYANFTQFGGSEFVAATNNNGVWTATYVIVAGAIDATGCNISFRMFDDAGNQTNQADSTNATVDNIAPVVTDANISIAGGSGTGGTYRIGDTLTVTWNDTAGGDNNSDTINGVNVDFSQFGGGAAVAAVNNAGTWTATFQIPLGTLPTSNRNVIVTVTDNAGNMASAADTTNAAIDATRPTATIVLSDHSLTVGETALVTITFSEAVSGLTNADLTVANGTLSAVGSADGGMTWSATFTPTTGFTGATNAITLANTGVADLAGNAGAGTTTSANYTIDTARPTATIVMADTALSIGDTSLVTITFIEAVTGFDNSDLTVPNGTLSPVSSADGGITWTTTFTPAAGLTGPTNAITLANTGVSDLSGNTGTGTTTSANFSIDVTRPTATIVMADSALSMGETSLVTITFSEAVTGFDNTDLTVPNGALSRVSSADGGITWTATFTPTAGFTGTTNAITLANPGVTDLAGNAGAGTTTSANYTIDTTRPTATIIMADTALSIGETSLVTITFSEAVNGFDNADLSVANGTLSTVTTADGGITWTATFTPTAGFTGTTNAITLANTGVADLAGNAGAGTTTSANYTIDTTRPTATIVMADTALSIGETSLVTITFSEAVNGFDNADLAVANGTLSTVSSADGGITWTATFTPTAGFTGTANAITLANTGVTDLAGNAGAGTTSSANFTIDTTRPTATIVVADTEMFIGEPSLVTVTFSEPVSGFTSADLTVGNGTLSAVTTTDGGITWTAILTPGANVNDATNVVTLSSDSVQDAAGNTNSGNTDSNNYAVDTTQMPAPSAPNLAPESDSGRLNDDDITNIRAPLITGSAASGTTITLFDTDGRTILGSTVAANGAWSITSQPLSDGVHALTAVASNNGAGHSAPSAPLMLVIDTIAPAPPAITSPSALGIVTSDTTPELSGAGAEPDAIITLRVGATIIATARADAAGRWSAQSVALGGGILEVSATATDVAGNTSAPSDATTLVITGPHVPAQQSMPVAPPLKFSFDERSGLDDTMADGPLAAAIAQATDNLDAKGERGAGRVFDLRAGEMTTKRLNVTIPSDLLVRTELASLRAQLLGGKALPNWIKFDPVKRTFTGDVPIGAPSVLTIELIGVDKDGKESRNTITITDQSKLPLEVKAQPASAQAPSRLSGVDLLVALGLQPITDGGRVPAPAGISAASGDAASPGRHLSGQLAREAQRFHHDADATLRQLEQIDNKPASEHI